MKELLQKLNKRIDRLEKEKETATLHINTQRDDRSYIRYRGNYRGRGMTRGRGDSSMGRRDYRTRRPTGSGTMQPTCFNCGTKGHIARNCPKE